MAVLTERELHRHVEFQVQEVVFELLSWQEGFFSFSEGPLVGVPVDAMVRIRTESVLMEGARRIDEWSRIEHQLPHLGVVPDLVPVEPGGPAAQLDLLPAEWEVLALVDGAADVRVIAQRLARSEFEVARTLFGLVTTGVVRLRDPGAARRSRASSGGDAGALLAAAEARLEAGDVAGAKDAALAAAAIKPGEPRVHVLLARVHLREGRVSDAVEEGRRAARLDPLLSEAHRWFGFALAAAGRFAEADEQFQQGERLADEATPDALRQEVNAARSAALTLAQILGGTVRV
jgi:tetratricopeptide (TPR) repeat protein